MKKQIIVTNIEWGAPKSAHLPKEVVIDIDETNEYLLEDIDGYADALSDYLSDTFEYCHAGFCVMVVIGEFDKDERYSIVEIDGELFALFNLKEDGTYEEKYECEEFAPGLYGIGQKVEGLTER